MTGSVRARLTFAVAVIVGTLTVAAALIAPRSVESALIDDRLDAEVLIEAAALQSGITVVGRDGDRAGSPELTALFGPDIADLAAALEGTGALDRLRAMRSDGLLIVTPVRGVIGLVQADGRVRVDGGEPDSVEGPIVTGTRLEQLAATLGTRSVFDDPFGALADGGSIEDFLAELDTRLESGVGEQLDLGELADLPGLPDELFSPELFDELQRELLGELPVPTPPDDRPRRLDQLTFGTRPVGDTEVIVSASTEGIDISVDRVRTALWAAMPIAIALTALATWLLAGRALRPVRAITDQTRNIRTGTLHERVPVPRSQDEVADLATVMNGMLDRLQRDDQRRRQFIADASHELRSPIAAIHTQAEVALAESVDAESAELAAGVLAETKRLGSIVDDLLAIARHDEELAPPGGIVDLDDIVLAEASRPRRVPIDTSRVSAGRVRGRSDELGRVVTHLLDNAARHATDRVQVTLGTEGDRVVFEVADDGPGVPEPDRERIFERFVRLDEARQRDAGGAGLGLAVVATVVAAAGGHIDVDDSDLGGARFRVRLPVAA